MQRLFHALIVCLSCVHGFGQDTAESHQQLIAKVQPSVVTLRVQGRDGKEFGIGTGFAIANDLIATNFHVIGEGRTFSIETPAKKKLKVLAVQASDVGGDLALIRIEPADLPILEFADAGTSEQGLRVLAFGNPQGLRNSVVEGIISARRQIDGREFIQLAMPIEQGNSGGPLVDLEGRVHGIINMKSAVSDNLGFAIPIEQLANLRRNPNPVTIDRWVRLNRINTERWLPLMGATWKQSGGLISARGMGNSFGGRSLCLSKQEPPQLPYEVAVDVRLDDESGAAGLVFHSDGGDRHYGFYPSAGNVRLSCFMGPSVYSWQVLKDVPSEHYVPGQWNRLKVRVEKNRIVCFVNGHQVIESTDQKLTSGKVGLAKFRGTLPDFKGFEVGKSIAAKTISESAAKWLAELQPAALPIGDMGSRQIQEMGQSGDLASRDLRRRADELEQQAQQLRRIAADVRRSQTLLLLSETMDAQAPAQLLHATLLIAKIDHPDLDIQVYAEQIEQMTSELKESLAQDANPQHKRAALHDYLFQQCGFHGSRSEYYHPANSHLNRVIDDREGLPITMSILYMEIGRRIGLNMEGLGLPGHFVVRHVLDNESVEIIDVFERGEILAEEDVDRMVRQNAGRPTVPEDFKACSNLEILNRVLNNLVSTAARREDGEAMLGYCDALVAMNPKHTPYRMMRAQLRGFTNRKTAAKEDLDWLLDENPVDLDRPLAERMRAALER